MIIFAKFSGLVISFFSGIILFRKTETIKTEKKKEDKMGMTKKVRYTVDFWDNHDQVLPTTLAWESKSAGSPTNENLAKFIKVYIDSLKAGGCNEHISKAIGYMPIPYRAVIRDHKNKIPVTIASWDAPMFMEI